MKNSIVKRIFVYIKNYRLLVLLSLILAAITVALSLYIPILTGDGVDMLIGKGNVDFKGLFGKIFVIISCVILMALCQWLMSHLNNRITFGVVKDIREDIFEKIQKLPIRYIDSKAYGDIVNRVISDVDTFADGLLMGFTQFFTGVLTIVGTLVFMLVTNVPIALVVVCITPVSFLVAKFISGRTFSLFKEQSVIKAKQTALTEEVISNEKVVKCFSKENDFIEKFEDINENLKQVSAKAIFYSSLTNPCTRFVNSLVYAGVGIFGALLAISGGISVGRLSCFLSYANQYTKPFNEISGVITELQNALACAGRIFEILDEKSEIPDDAGALSLSKVEGYVELKDVNFHYLEDKPLIEHLNLNVKPGMRVAIVGPTGCGKTTLINLLMRFYDVCEGRVSVDGHDIRNVTRHSLRDNFGMVLQETWLQEGTIRDNIRMGRPEATDEEVVDAAKKSHAHSFIRRLPKGYDTVIGEDGGALSQGQKQLLCIARIMLSLPPMLILDEATSSIDTMTEQRIQNAFKLMMEGRTSFIVAHRLSTIRESDVIIVMRDGHIVEQGNHDELLSKKGFYAQMYNSQYSQI
ncbi:MAG: ABC transporter ATP-binding protein/permease [Acetatifactor sp.]|nr:ABC transporter ATP-binding protein/permease [Acetatifactor sp.]